MRRIGIQAATALFVVAGIASAATATIPLLFPGERVQGLLSPAGERKSVAYAGVEGSILDLTAKALKGSRVVPVLTLLSPDGTAVDLGATNPKSAKSARARHVALGETGIWRIGVETPANAGGAFELSVSAKVPTHFAWSGAQTDAATVTDHFVPAAPGGLIAVSVIAKGKPAFDPTVELIAPSGASVKKVVGLKGRAAIPVARLAELGRYVVRVTGGPGAFKATAAVKPAKKRAPTYHDVEAPPGIQSFTPAQTTNDAVVAFNLDGFAFSRQQTVAVVDGASTMAADQIKLITAGGAIAELDLSGVAPGTYTLRVVTPEGNSTTAPGTVEVTNRTPGITSMSPVEVSNKDAFTLDLRGAGFDATSTVSLHLASDSSAIPVSIQSRTSHTAILATATPPSYVTGPCDLEIRDPDGAKVVVPGGIDLLGFRAPPAVLRQAVPSASQNFYPRDSAYDATHDRVLVAIKEGPDVSFVLFDPATLTVTDSLVVTTASLGVSSGIVVRPRVAWDKVSGTFALGLTAGQTNQVFAVVRVVSATNLHDTRLQSMLAWSVNGVSQVTPAANGDDGGYLVVWEQWEGSAVGGKMKTQVITPALTTDTNVQPVLASHPLGYIWEPVAAYQGNHRFVVAWAGTTQDDSNLAVHATVVDAAGAQTEYGPYQPATDPGWFNLFQPEINSNPNDGSMIVSFTYADVNAYHPGVVHLDAVTANPGQYAPLDANGQLPEGYIDSVRWNPARSEFVATMTNYADRVAVRRIGPDGAIHASPVLESYEGMWGILWSGPQAGQFGLARMFDGTADDMHFEGSTTMQVLAGRLR